MIGSNAIRNVLISGYFFLALVVVGFCIDPNAAITDELIAKSAKIIVAKTNGDGFGITRSGKITKEGEAIVFKDAVFIFDVIKTVKGADDKKNSTPLVVPLIGSFKVGTDRNGAIEATGLETIATVRNGLYKNQNYVLFLKPIEAGDERTVNGEKVNWTLLDTYLGIQPASDFLIEKILSHQKAN